VYYALLLIFANQFDAAEHLLHQAERGAQELPADQAQIILGWVFVNHSVIAVLSGDVERAVTLGCQALDLLPEMEVIPRRGALISRARTYLVSGDVTPESEQAVVATDAVIRTSDDPFAAVTSITLLARLHVLQGRLRQAAATFEHVRQVVPQSEVLHTIFSSLLYYFGLGDLLREWNDLQVADGHLVQGMALINEGLTVEPFVVVLGYTALARLQQARGETAAALATLDALEHLAQQRHFPLPLLTQIAAVRAQFELAQGHLAAAVHWADSSGLALTDVDLPYPCENEYLTLARVRLAQGRDDPAGPLLPAVLALLERLQASAEINARLSSVLEILLLRALALEAQGNRTDALATLEQALQLAAPEGYVRRFVDEGAPMLALLRLAHARSRVPGYVATLLAACGEPTPPLPLPPSAPPSEVLVLPLTEREREVLRLLLEGASNREIACRLVLSVNTVKRHVYNLCRKLGVQSRTQAIVRARTLSLL
jgi:LuxR family maltose regulon positive regulatory protein